MRAGKIDNVVSCSTEEESLLAKHKLVFSLVSCVCRVSYVCVCSCEKKIERNNQRKREGAVRGSTKVEEEAALREAAPTIGIQSQVDLRRRRRRGRLHVRWRSAT